MKRPDLSTYFATFPNDIRPLEIKSLKLWTAYQFTGMDPRGIGITTIVTELTDGRLLRVQNVGDVFDYDDAKEPDLIREAAECETVGEYEVEIFDTLQDMMDNDSLVTS